MSETTVTIGKENNDYWPDHIDIPKNDWTFEFDELVAGKSHEDRIKDVQNHLNVHHYIFSLRKSIFAESERAIKSKYPNYLAKFYRSTNRFAFNSIIYFMRYYQRNPLPKTDDAIKVAATCAHISCNILEKRFDSKNIPSCTITRRPIPIERLAEGDKKKANDIKDAIYAKELIVMEQLCFDLYLVDPYAFIGSLLQGSDESIDGEESNFWNNKDNVGMKTDSFVLEALTTQIYLLHSIEDVIFSFFVVSAFEYRVQLPNDFLAKKSIDLDEKKIFTIIRDFKELEKSSSESGYPLFGDVDINDIKAVLGILEYSQLASRISETNNLLERESIDILPPVINKQLVPKSPIKDAVTTDKRQESEAKATNHKDKNVSDDLTKTASINQKDQLSKDLKKSSTNSSDFKGHQEVQINTTNAETIYPTKKEELAHQEDSIEKKTVTKTEKDNKIEVKADNESQVFEHENLKNVSKPIQRTPSLIANKEEGKVEEKEQGIKIEKSKEQADKKEEEKGLNLPESKDEKKQVSTEHREEKVHINSEHNKGKVLIVPEHRKEKEQKVTENNQQNNVSSNKSQVSSPGKELQRAPTPVRLKTSILLQAKTLKSNNLFGTISGGASPTKWNNARSSPTPETTLPQKKDGTKETTKETSLLKDRSASPAVTSDKSTKLLPKRTTTELKKEAPRKLRKLTNESSAGKADSKLTGAKAEAKSLNTDNGVIDKKPSTIKHRKLDEKKLEKIYAMIDSDLSDLEN